VIGRGNDYLPMSKELEEKKNVSLIPKGKEIDK
jgi:hypothetical protein